MAEAAGRATASPSRDIAWQPVELTGWGRTARARSIACRPAADEDVLAALAAPDDDGFLAHGAGRSYGDAGLNDGGRALLTQDLAEPDSFDAESGHLVCNAGRTIDALMRSYLPRGYLCPVSPGTAFVTLGGALANDVHGKNHDRVGSFGAHVAWFDLALPSGEVRRVSPEADPELFAATVGGIGLTGIVLRLCLRMMPLPSAWVVVRERRMAGLEEFMAALAEARDGATFSVGWIDALAGGRRLGRGILETAEFLAEERPPMAPRRVRDFPFEAPAALLNPLSIGLFNEAYFRRVPAAGRERARPLDRFLYPLDSIGRWNRLYGRRGFYQFQCVIPDAESERGLLALLEAAGRARLGSFLAVLKTLGGAGPGHLSFPQRGFTLALDFPRRTRTQDLLARMERIVLDHGGRVYLAKDATLSPEGFAAMYPKLDPFREVLARVDPDARLQSDMARRLKIRI